MRHADLIRDHAGRVPREGSAGAAPDMGRSPTAEFASGIGNQAFSRLARSPWEADAQPDVGGYNREPGYAETLPPELLGGNSDAPDPGVASNTALCSGSPSAGVQGDAVGSEHEPLELDDPRATGELDPRDRDGAGWEAGRSPMRAATTRTPATPTPTPSCSAAVRTRRPRRGQQPGRVRRERVAQRAGRGLLVPARAAGAGRPARHR